MLARAPNGRARSYQPPENVIEMGNGLKPRRERNFAHSLGGLCLQQLLRLLNPSMGEVVAEREPRGFLKHMAEVRLTEANMLARLRGVQRDGQVPFDVYLGVGHRFGLLPP